MPIDAMRVWRDELAYAIKLADWAAGEGFCEIEGLQDPDEWCCQMWQELGPPNGDGYTADALAAAVIDRAIADAVEQERAKAEALAEALRLVSKRCGPRSQDGAIAAAALKAWEDTDAPR